MRFEGIHHVTCITGDAPGNVDFYTGVLGLRLVKKTVNQDDPTVYHLFYADEDGSAGADITFFEYPGARRGRAGDGMVHTVSFRVGSSEALAFWQARLEAEGIATTLEDDRLRFEDPEGLGLELVVSRVADEPLIAQPSGDPCRARAPGVRRRARLRLAPRGEPRAARGRDGLRLHRRNAWEVRGAARGGLYAYDEPPAGAGVPGAGTVHHVAWASQDEEHAEWQRRVSEAGMRATPVIDRFWFKSVYFREPSGVLFELATLGPGFGVDEDPAHLGEALILPPAFEHLRGQVEQTLTPLPDPRAPRA